MDAWMDTGMDTRMDDGMQGSHALMAGGLVSCFSCCLMFIIFHWFSFI